MTEDGETEMVISPDDMDDETFARHMNFRHGDSLGGLPELRFSAGCAPGLPGAWRAFHRRLHKFRHDLEHEHEGQRNETVQTGRGR